MFYPGLHIYQIFERHYLPRDTTKWHIHNYFHYVYVLKGKGELKLCLVDHEHGIEIGEGGMLLIPLGLKHLIKAKEDFNFETIEVKFTSYDKVIMQSLISMPCQIGRTNPQIECILRDILKETKHKDLFYKDAISIKLMQVIILNLRMFSIGKIKSY